jgi:hypothetical protein
MIHPSPKIFKKGYGLCEKEKRIHVQGHAKKERTRRHSPSLKNFKKERGYVA